MPARTPLFRTASLALLAAAALAPAAEAKISAADVAALPRGGTIEDGEVALKLSGSAKGRLSKAGVRVSASGGGSAKGSKWELPVAEKGTVVDPIAMKGELVTGGGLTLRRGGRSAKLSKFTLAPGGKNRVTAKVGSKTVTLGTVSGGKPSFRPYADGILKGANLKLSSSGARALSKAVGGGFSSGSFAKVDVRVTMRELPLTAGSVTVALDPAFAGLLAQNGVAVVAGTGGTVEGTNVKLTLTGGAFDPEGLTGRLAFSGEVQLVRGGDTIRLYDWRTAIAGKQADLFASLNTAISAVSGSVDVREMEVRLDGTAFTANGAVLTLTDIATKALQTSFGITVAPGTRFGVVSMAGTTPAGG